MISIELSRKALDQIRQQRVLFEGADAPIGLDEYQAFTLSTDQNPRPGVDGLGFNLLGLFGEVGSLLSELKKKQRDKDSYVAYRESAMEELGDSLWYFANSAQRTALLLSSIAQRVSATLGDWDFHGREGATTFRDLQAGKDLFAGPLSNEAVELKLLTLAGKTGGLLDDFSAGKLDANRDALSADLVEIFRALIAAADEADVSLEEAALHNVVKTLGRWPTSRAWGPKYDDDFDEDEQLPRRIEMVFKEKEVAGNKYVIQECHGIKIGDRLTDNRLPEDDYRFHDVFHLAYAAILNWSPVLRALFKVKRKSDPQIDENQDGARDLPPVTRPGIVREDPGPSTLLLDA